MKDRDMYYGGYGMGYPIAGVNYDQLGNINNSYSNSQFNDIINRVERLERGIKRLDQRLTRLETPYANNNYNNEPDNNMYMM